MGMYIKLGTILQNIISFLNLYYCYYNKTSYKNAMIHMLYKALQTEFIQNTCSEICQDNTKILPYIS